MLLLASAITPAVFVIGIGFSNANRIRAQALKDDRGTGALSAAEPASEGPPEMLRRRAASGLFPKHCQRLTNDACPCECPNGSQRRPTSKFVSRRPSLCYVRAPLPCKALRGCAIGQV
jgi:hypothetical protein